MKKAWKWLDKKSQSLAIFFLMISILVLLLWPYATKIISTGHVGVFYRLFGGTVLDRNYGEGLHCFLPWNRMFVYDCRVQREDFAVTALTQGGLQVDVEISAIYNVKKKEVPELHFRVGPNYAEKVIVPGAIFAVRGVVGSLHQSDIYNSNPIEMQNRVFKLLDEVLQQKDMAINLHGIFVRKIQLPDKMAAAIEEKHKAEQNIYQERYQILQAYERYKRTFLEASTIRMAQRLINQGLTEEYLRYSGIRATRELAASTNAKLVIIGGKDGLPLLLNPDTLKSSDGQPETTTPGPGAPGPGDLPEFNQLALSELGENLNKLDDILKQAESDPDESILNTLPRQLLKFDKFFKKSTDMMDLKGVIPVQDASPQAPGEKSS